VFLMPADVRRSLKMPPVSITAEKTPAASENHRGRRRGRSLLSGHESSGGSRGDATSSAESHGRGRRWATRHRSAGIHRARVGEADSCRVSAQHCFRALRVRTCREPRRRAGHSRQIPPMRFPTEARDEYPSWRSSSDCPIVQVRPIPRSRDRSPDGSPCPRQAGIGPSSPRCHEPVGPSPEIGNEIPTRETQMS